MEETREYNLNLADVDQQWLDYYLAYGSEYAVMAIGDLLDNFTIENFIKTKTFVEMLEGFIKKEIL